jgi:hypothetical protein
MWILNNTFFWIFLFLFQVFLLSKVSNNLFNQIYYFLHKIFSKDSTVVLIISFIFLPGTFIHELSHALTATLLGSRVTRFSIWPKVENGGIKMGYAQFTVLDVFRNTLIGISPLIIGISILYFLIYYFFSVNVYLKILFVYLIFQVSNSMFLSESDIKDLKILLMVVLSFGIIFYFVDTFYLKFGLFQRFTFNSDFNSYLSFFYYLNIFFVFTLFFNFFLLILIKLLNKFHRY